MKLTSTSAAKMYNSIESGHPWKTPRIKIKGSDRRPFILILDWMLVKATLIMWMNLSLYLNIYKAEMTKSQTTLLENLRISQDIRERFSFSLLDILIMSQIVERVCKIDLSFIRSWLVFTYYCICFLQLTLKKL